MNRRENEKRNLLLLCLGGFISGIGDHLYAIGISIFLYETTKSIESVIIMWLFRAVFRVQFQYIYGVVIDRYNKKKIIVITNFVSVFIAFGFIFINESNIYISYILAFLLQSLNDLDECGENAILPDIISKENLVKANSKFSFLSNIVTFLAPALAGIIYKTFGGKPLFIVNALSFLAASIIFQFIKYKFSPKENKKDKRAFLKEGAEGFKILSKHRVVMSVVTMMTVYAVLGRFYEVFKLPISEGMFTVGAVGIVYFQYAIAFGGLFAIVFSKIFSKYNKLKLMIGFSSVISICYIVFGYTNNYVLSLFVMCIFGLASNMQGIYTRTIIQGEIPSEYLGRVFSTYKIVLTLSAIVGLVLSSVMYRSIGAGHSFMIFAVISIILNGIVLMRFSVGKRDITLEAE